MTKWIIETEPDKFAIVGTRGFTPKNARCPLPNDVVEADYPYVKAQQQLIDEEMQWVAYVDGALKAAGEALKTKKESIETAYANMIEDVYSNLYDVFRTRKPETATAEYETWKHMKTNAALYAGKGLKVDHQVNKADATELFSPGSALDTEQKILDFATRKIEQAEAYGVYRAERIQQFKTEKEGIENG